MNEKKEKEVSEERSQFLNSLVTKEFINHLGIAKDSLKTEEQKKSFQKAIAKFLEAINKIVP